MLLKAILLYGLVATILHAETVWFTSSGRSENLVVARVMPGGGAA